MGERSRSRHFKAKLTGLLVAATLVGSTGLAFAGALPPGLQNAASSFLSHVGVTVPNDHPTNKGGTISQIATTTTATGVDKGAQISTVASNGHSQAGQHGRPSGTARQSGSHGQSGSHSQAGEHAQNGSDGGESTNAGSPGSADGGTAGAAQAGGGGSSSGSGHGGNGP